MVHITINERSKEAKAFLAYIKTLSFVNIESNLESEAYEPEFVAKIKAAQKEPGKVMKTPSELWESIK